MANLIVEWHPERKDRILLCCPLRHAAVPRSRSGRIRKASSSAPTTAPAARPCCCELAHHMPDLKSKYGVDFVLFDGEELVYDRPARSVLPGQRVLCPRVSSPIRRPTVQLGRAARHGGRRRPADLSTKQQHADAANAAARLRHLEARRDLGVKEFIPSTRSRSPRRPPGPQHIAKIPTFDIIDFDYPTPAAATTGTPPRTRPTSARPSRSPKSAGSCWSGPSGRSSGVVFSEPWLCFPAKRSSPACAPKSPPASRSSAAGRAPASAPRCPKPAASTCS